MGFAARLIVLCVLACSASGAASASSSSFDDLLVRMRAANPDLLHAHIISTSRHLVDGEPATLTTHAQDLRYRQDQCSGAVCLATYFDGERLYNININGTALPRSQRADLHVRALRVLAMQAFLDPRFDGIVYDGGMQTFQGKRMHRLFVEDRIALPLKVYVDPKTGLIAGAQSADNSETISMRDYRRVGHYTLPFEIDRNGAPLEIYLSRTASDSELPKPHGLRAEMTAASAQLPLDPQSVSPLARCELAGVSAPCLIDSGNSAMAMSVELAERLNLRPQGMLRVLGLGKYATEVVRAGPLQMGGVRFPDANYVVLSDIHRYGYDLVVGADVLAALPVTIDSKHHVVYFGANAAPADSGTAVPITFENFVPVVDVTLGPQPSALAVDTGDQSNINLAYDYYAQHEDLFTATSTKNVSGVGGESEEIIGEIGSVRIGSITAEHQQIGATKTLHGTADGHLGAGFLSNYRVELDYARAVMRLLPLQY